MIYVSWYQGADLRGVPLVVGIGGALVRHAAGLEFLGAALARQSWESLTPRAPKLALDRHYVLAASGSLSTEDPAGAIALLNAQAFTAEG